MTWAHSHDGRSRTMRDEQHFSRVESWAVIRKEIVSPGAAPSIRIGVVTKRWWPGRTGGSNVRWSGVKVTPSGGSRK